MNSKWPISIKCVEGTSMLPHLKPGKIIITSSLFNIKPGAVVIIRHGGRDIVKRIKEFNQSTNKIFLLGDNPPNSTDSRSFGWLDADQIIAKVVWPSLSF